MLLDKISGSNGINADYLGIKDARVMVINSYKDEVTVDIEYLKQLEELAISNLIEKHDLKEELRELTDSTNSTICQLQEENKRLEDKLNEIKEKTNYFDLDYEAIKLQLIEKALLATKLESELNQIRGNTEKVKYDIEDIENEINEYLINAWNNLKNMSSEKYMDALQKIGLLEKENRRLEIDNKILVEKVGEEVSHSERIKKGYDNVSKSGVTREVIEELIEKGLSKTAIAKQLNISRKTIYNKLEGKEITEATK